MTAYVVIYEQAEDGAWGAYLPDVPGVFALGKTREETADRMREAIEAYKEELRLNGGSLPTPVHVAGTIVTG